MLTGAKMQEHTFPPKFNHVQNFVQYIDKIMCFYFQFNEKSCLATETEHNLMQ